MFQDDLKSMVKREHDVIEAQIQAEQKNVSKIKEGMTS